MALRVSSLSADTATVQVDIGGETLNVVYRPSGLTPETEDVLRELTSEQRGGASLIAFLQGTLVSWDLLDDDDQPLPVDEATLRNLPTLFLSLVGESIAMEMRPNRSRAETSGGGSLQAVD